MKNLIKDRRFLGLLTCVPLILGSSTAMAQLPDTWTRKSDIGFFMADGPQPRSHAVAFTIGSKGYMGTGFNGATRLDDFWEYDPATDSWSQKANVGGGGRSGAVGFSIGSKGYVGTGTAFSGYKNDFWEYDPAANTWTQKANFGGAARTSAAGFVIGSKGYIGTGETTASGTNGTIDFWEYDPATNAWTQKVNFGGTARTSAAAFATGGKGYIATGSTGSADMWAYDPVANTWTVRASVPGSTRWGAMAFDLNGKGYLGLGSMWEKDFYEYDPVANTWTQKPDFTGNFTRNTVAFSIGAQAYVAGGWLEEAFNSERAYSNQLWQWNGTAWSQKSGFGGKGRTGAVGFSIGSKGYIGTGRIGVNSLNSSNKLKDFWEYDPTSNTWSQKADYGGGRVVDAVGFSIGSKGYIGTGGTDLGYSTDFWEYDPTGNVWIQKANFPAQRASAAAFSLNGKGYVGTGWFGGDKNEFWEYDPIANTWTQKANVGGSGRSGAIGFSAANKGYIGLGSNDDLWEYDPASNIWSQKADFPNLGWKDALGLGADTKGYVWAGWTSYGTGGSSNSGSYYPQFYEYDPVNNAWTEKAAHVKRMDAAGFVIGNKPYAGSGFSVTDFSNYDFNQYNYDFWQYTPGTALSLQTGALSGSSFCTGAPMTVAFTASGSYDPGNVFTAQLSDASGSFAAPVNIGTIAGTGNGTINATIPAGLPGGTAYRIRIVSSSPAFTSTTNSAVFTINPTFTPEVTISADDTSICQGTPVTFTAALSGSYAVSGYQWKVNGILMSSGSNTYSNMGNPLANNDVVTCEVTTGLPCATKTKDTSNALVMTVNPVVYPAINITVSEDTVCNGTAVTFTAVAVNGGTAPTFEWRKNSAVTGGNSTTYTDNAPANNDDYYCVLTSNAICASYTSLSSNSIIMTVKQPVTPQVSITASANPACSGASVAFTAVPVNGGTGPVYQWQKNGTNVGTNNAVYNAGALINNDAIKCTVTSNEQCLTTASATSNTVTMTVTPIQTPALMLSGPASVPVGNTVTINAALTNAPASYTIDWYNNGGFLSSTTTPSVSYTKQNGTDNITAELHPAAGQCYNSGTSNTWVVGFTNSIGGTPGENGLAVYPNPFGQVLVIEGMEVEGGYELMNVQGQVVRKGMTAAKGRVQVDGLETLPAGAYLLRIRSKDGQPQGHVQLIRK